jgi:hypothetical protein
MNAPADEPRRSARFGWTSLLLWSTFGLLLEAAHGFKLGLYLDDDLRHSLLRLAHAHGVILSLVVIVYGRSGPAHADGRGARLTGRLLRAGACVIPLGFVLSAVRPHEGDPGLPVLLVPLGAALLIAGLGRVAWASWRGL